MLHCSYLAQVLKSLAAGEAGGAAEGFFNAQELVIFGGALSAAGGAGFDLSGIDGDGKVGDGAVLGFAGAVGDNRGIASIASHFDRLQGLGESADLIDFDENAVGGLFLDALFQADGISYEKVVAD